jgi:AcrR family transcriptional regulator
VEETHAEPVPDDYIGSRRLGRRRSRSRSERADENRRALLRAAATIVARYGYNGASVSRITELAGVAQGTFYNYFPTRRALFEHLLPETGEQMLEYIRERVHGSRSYRELEARGIRAFFSFLVENPSFLRVLDDAEIAVPTAYRKHMRNLERHYLKALLRGGDAHQLAVKDPRKLRVFIYSLMGARRFLAFRYASQGARSRKALATAASAYDQFLQFGLGGRAARNMKVKTG